MPVSDAIESKEIVTGVIESLNDQKIVLCIPRTSYELHLIPSVPASAISTSLGKRIKGTIHGKALRMSMASGGGRFVEPIVGEPRIVAGVVQSVDAVNRRVLVDTGVPMWLTLDARQPLENYQQGQLVNCYVQSGAKFSPA